MTTSKRDNVPLLDSDNYALWRRLVRAVMIEKDYWPAIENFLGERVTAFTEEQVKANIQRKASALLERTVSPALHYLVKEDEQPHLSWLRIKKHFEQPSESRVVYLRSALQALKIQKDESVATYFGRAEKLRDLLANAGATITDAELRTYLLVGLPKTPLYRLVLQTLQTNSDKSLDTLRESLQLLDLDPANVDKGQAFSVAGVDSRKCWFCNQVGHVKSKCPKRREMICSYCNKSGHTEDKCFQKKRDADQKTAASVSIAY